MNEPTQIAQTPPDRLSTDPRSPHYVVSAHERGIGISFNGKERTDVDEYCISEGWIRVAAGKTVDRKGKPMLIKLKGKVAAYFRADPDTPKEEPVQDA
jgi:hypothetical protein